MAEGTFTWHVEAYEKKGNLWLKWGTNSPFRAQQGQIRVYKGDTFPENPEHDTEEWAWDNDKKQDWDTGLRWGIGWHCAYIAQSSPNGPYVRFISFVTSKSMGPDVAK
jgi:hypothetical protein